MRALGHRHDQGAQGFVHRRNEAGARESKVLEVGYCERLATVCCTSRSVFDRGSVQRRPLSRHSMGGWFQAVVDAGWCVRPIRTEYKRLPVSAHTTGPDHRRIVGQWRQLHGRHARENPGAKSGRVRHGNQRGELWGAPELGRIWLCRLLLGRQKSGIFLLYRKGHIQARTWKYWVKRRRLLRRRSGSQHQRQMHRQVLLRHAHGPVPPATIRVSSRRCRARRAR